jgi:hypothetical protein
MDPANLTDAELVAAGNELVRRTMSRIAPINAYRDCVQVIASSYGHSKGEFTITWIVAAEPSSGDGPTLRGGDPLQLAAKHLVIADIKTDPPVEVTPMLPAPAPSPKEQIDEAVWHDVEPAPGPQHSAALDDDVLF